MGDCIPPHLSGERSDGCSTINWVTVSEVTVVAAVVAMTMLVEADDHLILSIGIDCSLRVIKISGIQRL